MVHVIRDARDVTQTCPPPRLATPPALLQASTVDGIAIIILAILFLLSGPLGAVGLFMIGGLRKRLDAQARQIAILERRIELAEARGIAPSAPTNAVTGPSIEAATPRATEPPVEDAVPAPEPDREPTMLASPSASRGISITPKATPPAPPHHHGHPSPPFLLSILKPCSGPRARSGSAGWRCCSARCSSCAIPSKRGC